MTLTVFIYYQTNNSFSKNVKQIINILLNFSATQIRIQKSKKEQERRFFHVLEPTSRLHNLFFFEETDGAICCTATAMRAGKNHLSYSFLDFWILICVPGKFNWTIIICLIVFWETIICLIINKNYKYHIWLVAAQHR